MSDDSYTCQCGCNQPIPYSYLHGHRYVPKYIKGHNTKTVGYAAQQAQAKARRDYAQPTLICQCGCGSPIPPKPSHRYRPPRYIQSHYLKLGTHTRIKRLREVRKAARLQPPADWTPPSGICECGCGLKTSIAKVSKPERGQYAGFFLRFVNGHNGKLNRKEQSSSWKGGRRVLRNGYVLLRRPEHPHAGKDGYILEHRLVYEESRGVTLSSEIQVHHINGHRADNRPENLIATTQTEHALVHKRAAELISLSLDMRLLDAWYAFVSRHHQLPDLEELTLQVYQLKTNVY